MASVDAFAPDAEVRVLDDCTSDGTYELLRQWVAAHPGARLDRNPRPRGYSGLAVSYFSLLAALAAEPTIPELVIRIDPDLCFIAPGLVEIVRRRMTALGPGIVGAYRISANGRPRSFVRQRRNLLLDLLPLGLHKDRRSVRVGRPYWGAYLARARRHGYTMGEHVLGAFSAVHGDTVRALRDAKFLTGIPEHYRALTVEEDVLLGLGTRAVGHQLIDINADPAHPDTWIQFRPPVPLDADQLLQRGVRVVHPLKATPQGDALRAVFRGRR